MIALRLAGCACVLAAAALFCAAYSASLDKALEAYERAVRFITLVRREIEFYETPFPQIARKFAAAENISVEPPPHPEVGGSDAAVDAVGEALASLPDADDAARFASFYASVGGGFCETVLRSCDDAKLYFEEQLAEMRKDHERRRRVCFALTLFTAATACLLAI